jgi:hypothetical protein
MGKVFLGLLLALIWGISADAQVNLYSENFNSYGNNTKQGTGTPPGWTLDESAPNLESNRTFSVQSGAIRATFISRNNVNPRGVGYWLSRSISISGYENVSLAVNVLASTSNMESNEDYVRCQYSTNNGSSWTTFTNNGLLRGNISSSRTASHSGITGNTIIVRVEVVNDMADETYRFDNISVTGTPTVVTPSFWVRADAGTGTSNDNTGVTAWQDQAGSNNASTSGTRYPVYQSNEANFNPGLQFDGVNDQMTISRPAQDDLTFALVVRPDAAAQSGTQWWSGDGIFDGEVAGVTQDFGGLSMLGSSISFGTTGDQTIISDNPIFGGNIPHVIIATRSAGSGVKTLYIDGDFDKSGPGLTGSIVNPSGFRIGSLYSNNNYYDGFIFEILVFQDVLGSNDRQELETYFALKYGMTLNKNYIADGNVVYDISSYGNDVAGLVNGTAYSLEQKVASSINTSVSSSSDITMATTNNFTASNQDGSRTNLGSGEYLIWGNNGASTSNWINDGDYQRVGRFWKTQNTGNVGDLFFQVNLSGYPSAGSYAVIVDNDNNLSNGVIGTYNLTNSSGDLYSGQVTFPSGTNYFTIGTLPSLDVNLVSYQNISKNGVSDGMFEVAAIGGSGTYSYSWSNGGNSSSISGLGEGAYTVTVSSGSLSVQKTFYLYNPDEVVVNSTIVSTPNCPGNETGEIVLDVTLPNTKSIYFSGDDYIALNDSKSGTNAFPELTVCAWIKVASGKGGWAILDYDRSEYFNVSVGDNSGGDNFVHFDTHSVLDGSTHDFHGNINVADNNWHHIACVYDGEHKYIYVDGILDTATSGGSMPHNNQSLGSYLLRYGFIGEGSEADYFNGGRNNLYFEGRIALVELWSRALSIQEVKARRSSSSNGNGLVGQWKIEEGAGNNIAATVGGNGTLYGSSAWETDSFYSVTSYAWSKDEDAGFSKSTKDINSLSEGTYRCQIVITNGGTLSVTESINVQHQNITTNPVSLEP